MFEKNGVLRQFGGMNRKLILPLLLVALTLAGCSKPAPAVTPAPVPTSVEPTQAQPKLPTMKIFFSGSRSGTSPLIATLDAELALTEQQERTGMMFRTNIQDSDSMLFVLPFTQQASFWMKNCPESISAAYISSDGVIQEIHHLEKNDTNTVFSATDNIRFVLETSDGWFERHDINAGSVIRTEKGSLAETFLNGH
jgi:hypothetical protein